MRNNSGVPNNLEGGVGVEKHPRKTVLLCDLSSALYIPRLLPVVISHYDSLLMCQVACQSPHSSPTNSMGGTLFL